jgi:hypothetical protein
LCEKILTLPSAKSSNRLGENSILSVDLKFTGVTKCDLERKLWNRLAFQRIEVDSRKNYSAGLTGFFTMLNWLYPLSPHRKKSPIKSIKVKANESFPNLLYPARNTYILLSIGGRISDPIGFGKNFSKRKVCCAWHWP